MPKPLRKHNAEPLDPHETISFHPKDGQCVQLPIFRDIDTNAELVQCDLCGLFFTLTKRRRSTHLRSHRGFGGCQKTMERKAIQQREAQVAAEETATRQALFGGRSEGNGGNSCMLSSCQPANTIHDNPATPTHIPSPSVHANFTDQGTSRRELDENATGYIPPQFKVPSRSRQYPIVTLLELNCAFDTTNDCYPAFSSIERLDSKVAPAGSMPVDAESARSGN